jgi:ferredoxin-thioredoxin reductase catalytic subunit
MGAETEKIIKIWEEFVANQRTFKLNPDREIVRKLAEGVLENERNYDLKFCPCRLRTGDRQEDFKLICPCNFFIQKIWQEKGECWCGLFVAKRK